MLLDTNAISAWAKEDRRLLNVLRTDRPWYLPSIALGEFRYGVLNSDRREELEAWLDEIERVCTVLSADGQCARRYAVIRNALTLAGIIIPYHDIWIAAIAQEHDLDVV